MDRSEISKHHGEWCKAALEGDLPAQKAVAAKIGEKLTAAVKGLDAAARASARNDNA